MIENIRTHLLTVFYIVIITLGLFLRFWQLENVPSALYMDEADHVITGATLHRFGTDLSGEWKPQLLKPYSALNVTAELPAIFYWFAQIVVGGTPAESAHLVNALFGLGTIIATFFIIKNIFKSNKIALFSVLLLIVNPWHIYLSRMAYEAAISLFFQSIFLLGASISIFKTKKTLKDYVVVFLSLIVGFFFGYFTYHGAKFTLPIIGITTLFLQWKFSKDTKLNWLITLTLSILILLSSIFLLHSSQTRISSRSSELIVNSDYIQSLQTQYVSESIHSPLLRLFTNKFVIIVRELVLHYGSVFDSSRLFFKGTESGFQFSLIVSGFFYVTQFVLIILGFVWLFKKSKEKAVCMLVLLLVSPAASAITVSYQSIFRSALTYLLLNSISGLGLFYVFENYTQGFLKIIKIVLCSILVLEIIWFGYNYFYRFPIITSENFEFSQKVLSRYVENLEEPTTIIVDKDPYLTARSILIYTDMLTELSADDLSQFKKTDQLQYYLPDISISSECLDITNNENGNQIISTGKMKSCKYDQYLATSSSQLVVNQAGRTYNTLSSPKDNGAYFYIINDSVCEKEETSTNITVKEIRDFSLRELSKENFCEKWVKSEVRIVEPIQDTTNQN